MTPDADDVVRASRRTIRERLAVPALVFSADGVTAHVSGPIDLGCQVGDLVVAGVSAGSTPVVQLETLEIVERDPVELDLGDIAIPGVGTGGARGRLRIRSLEGSGRVLGILAGDGTFSAGPGPVFDEVDLRPASRDEERLVRSTITGDTGPEVGTLLSDDDLVVHLRAKGLTRHTFLCGQSGSGKTYTTGVLLEGLRLATELPVIVLDPNSDHVRLGELVDDADDHPAAELYRRIAADGVVASARGRGGDLDLVAHFSDLPLELGAALLHLDPIDDLDEYAALRQVSDRLRPPYSITELAEAAGQAGAAGGRLATRITNLGIDRWSVWCRPGESSIIGSQLLDRPFVVLDVGSLSEPHERQLISATLMHGLWVRRSDRQPRLVVVDEAHNVFPARPGNPLLETSTDRGVLIAGEGRKFGIHLLVATQRPDKVHPNVVSQCDNLVLLRMNSRSDVDELVTTFSHIPSGMIERSPSLGLGQVLYGGPIAPVPVFALTRRRLTAEGGADLPTDWAVRRSPATGSGA